MLLLILAIAGFVVSCALGVLIEFANMMSDAPGVRASHWPTFIGFALSTFFLVGWWAGW